MNWAASNLSKGTLVSCIRQEIFIDQSEQTQRSYSGHLLIGLKLLPSLQVARGGLGARLGHFCWAGKCWLIGLRFPFLGCGAQKLSWVLVCWHKASMLWPSFDYLNKRDTQITTWNTNTWQWKSERTIMSYLQNITFVQTLSWGGMEIVNKTETKP